MTIKMLLSMSLVVATTTDAAAEGPFSHSSNGVTQPIIVWQGPNIVSITCVPGSRCALRTSAAPVPAGGTQTVSLWFRTGTTLEADHYAIGVRGNAADGPCTAPSILLANPYWGRGIAIYPGAAGGPKVTFENFTLSCRSDARPPGGRPGALVDSAFQHLALATNTQYVVTLWANDTNTGYSIERRYYNPQDAAWDLLPVADGDCLAQAAADERYKCGKLAVDSPSANRTFVASVFDTPWSVTSWYLY